MADPDWRGGAYETAGVRPEKGLAVARMAAHITYLSEAALQRKFGRELQRDGLSWGFETDFQGESDLRHQGARLVHRVDAHPHPHNNPASIPKHPSPPKKRVVTPW